MIVSPSSEISIEAQNLNADIILLRIAYNIINSGLIADEQPPEISLQAEFFNFSSTEILMQRPFIIKTWFQRQIFLM